MWKHVSSTMLQFRMLKSLRRNYDCFKMLSCAVPCTQHVCSVCQQCHNRHFSTSNVLQKKKKSRLTKMLQKDLPHKLKLRDPYNVRPKPKQPKLHVGSVIIRAGVTVQEVADAVEKSIDDVFEAMMYIENYNTDKYDNPSAVIDDVNVVRELVKRCRHMYPTRVAAKHKDKEDRDAHQRPPPDPEQLTKRPPVVTIMGHVDHGKTTLLDALRKSNIVEKEFGGITQHIGAFSVQLPDKKELITFLDTPGHAAFSSMRARGAHATDIVILVVAADDGVMEQTVESIKYARNAEVDILVAINKVDKPEADIERTKRELLAQGVELEDYGGDVQSVAISALKGTGLAELQDAVLTQAELMDLKGDNSGLAEGIVIESRTDQARGGKLATILVQRGTLKKGNILVAGTSMAKVRLMLDDTGESVISAPPSTPVEVTGWRELPHPGDEVLQVESESRARDVIKYRQGKAMEEKMEKDAVVIGQKVQEHQRWYQAELEKKRAIGRRKRFRDPRREKESVERTKPHLGIIIRGDVDGSVEALLDVLTTYKSNKCDLDIVNFGVGPVTETDLELAQTFNGVIYAFNVTVPELILQRAEELEIPLRNENVIYKLIDLLREDLNSRLPQVEKQEVIGKANVLQEFLIRVRNKKVPVAGCRCASGNLMKKQHLFRLTRGDEVVHEGPIISLKHFKNEVDSIKTDTECGIMMENSEVRFQPGDVILCYRTYYVDDEIDWDAGF